MKAKVIVGMSGGVDSSVAAFLLQQEGYQVEGMFMKNWEQDDNDAFCAHEQDIKDAQTVCDTLGIPLHGVNFAEQYWQSVFTHFLDEYAKARTPNPDVLCNKEIKFKAFLQHALTLGADFIATGHYAKVQHHHEASTLHKAKDRDKDQTYFLHAINKEALKKTLFPVGHYLKSDIRAIAKDQNLVTHNKKDSTGICFIGERRFKTFLNEYMLAVPGDIKNMNNEIIGRHDGLMFYTIGQRQGLGIGGVKSASEEPWYVVDKDPSSHTLWVAQGAHHPRLYTQGLICGPIHWLTPTPWELPMTCFAKTRYRQQEQACVVSPGHEQHSVMFATPQRAVTPGQYIVFYDKTLCLGGAVIEQVIR